MSFFFKYILIFCVALALTGCFKSSEERAAEHLENGITLAAAGDYPRAIVEFRNTLKLDDKNEDAHRQMARAHLALDQLQAAYGSYLRLVEQTPDDVEGRTVLSEMAFLGQNWEEFDRHSQKLVEIAGDLSKSKAIKLGGDYRLAVMDGDIPARDALIDQAEELAQELPDDPILRRVRVDAYTARGAYRDALALIDAAIARDGDDISFYATKLALLGRLEDESALEATLREMLDVFPDDQSTQQTYLRYLLSRERLDDAETFLETLFAQSAPEDANTTFFSLINFLRQTKSEEVALARIDAGLVEPQADNQIWQMLRASLIFDMGQRDEGIAALEAVLVADPTTMTATEIQDAKTALAQMLLRNGNDVGARQQVEAILTDDPNVPGALKMRAAWQIDEDNTTAAINDLRIALDQDPNDADAMVLMANAYARAGNKDLTQNFLARAAEASNNAPRYALLLSEALIRDEKFLQAENALISALRIAPGNIEVLQELGQVYLNLDDLSRTEQVVQTLTRIESDPARAAAQGLQTELIARRLGLDEAVKFLEQQAAESGDEVASALTIIQTRLQTGRPDDALRTAQDAVAKTPDEPRLRSALALSYASTGDFPAAEAVYEGLIADYPEATNVYLQLARIKSAQGDFAAGADVINRGLDVQPEAPDLLWGRASYLERAGDIDGAIDIYDALYARNSDSLVIANNLASLLATYRDDVESLDRAERIARRLNGTDIPAFQDTYGYILFRRGDADGALPYLEPAAAGLPQDANVQFHLAETYAALGRATDAISQMRKALDVTGPLGDPDFRAKVSARLAEVEATLTSE